jgi:iron complex outermembrane receptor protein
MLCYFKINLVYSKENKMFKKSKLVVSVAACLGVFSAGVSASVIEKIEITAQKRVQPLQSVGIAVTALSGDQMDALGLDNAQQVTAMAPGVTTIQPNGPSSFFVSIRGVGQNDFSGDHQESPVAIYLDEAYISAASGAGFQLFDMERAEVLRGPQGTLFGRNATGGLVHYITKKPTNDLEGYFDVTVGAYNQRKFEGAIGGGLTEDISGRLSFVNNKHDGYINNRIGTDLNNGNDWGLRAQLLIESFKDINWLLSVRAGDQDINSGFFEHSSARKNPNTGLGEHFNGLDLQGTGDSLVPSYQDTDNDVHAGAYNVIGHNRLETAGITNNISWDLDEFEITFITDYSTLKKDYLEDSDASPNDFFAFFLKSDIEQFSQEIRVNGFTDTVDWVVGAFYLDIDGEFANGGAAQNFFSAQFPGFGLSDPSLNYLGLNTPFKTETKTTALFAQGEFDITEALSFTAGIRWSNEQKEANLTTYFSTFETADSSTVTSNNALDTAFAIDPDNFHYFHYGPTGTTGAGGLANAFGFSDEGNYESIDDDLITGKLQLDWKVDKNTLVYLGYNRGVKAGGYNAPLDPTDLIDGNPDNGNVEDMRFDEEILNAYELGLKWSSVDDKLRINSAAYYYDYQNYQAFRLEGLTTFVFNTDSIVKGAEIEVQSNPFEGLDLIAGIAYIDNVVEDAFRQPDGQLLDRRAIMTPEWNANALVRYEWDFMDGFMAVQLDATYLSEHYFQLKNAPVGLQNGYILSNARVSYTNAEDSWTVAVFVNNLADKEYRTMALDLSGTPAQAGFGLTESYYGTPRWWGASFKYKFE